MMMNLHNNSDEDPEYSVRMPTDGGWVYLAEFRTHGEAVETAQEAANQLGIAINVCRCGDDLQQFHPTSTAADTLSTSGRSDG